MSEAITTVRLWIAAKRRKILNPIAKVMILVFLVLFTLLPCPFGVVDFPLFVAVILLVLFSAVMYMILAFNDHKIWLIVFMGILLIGSFALSLAAYSYCSRLTVVTGLSLKDVNKGYESGISFRLKDGNAAIKYAAILNIGQQDIFMAPLVPILSAWNTSQPVFAWAYAQVPPWSDGTEVAAMWANPILHEGVLNNDPALTG